MFFFNLFFALVFFRSEICAANGFEHIVGKVCGCYKKIFCTIILFYVLFKSFSKCPFTKSANYGNISVSYSQDVI